MVWPPEICFPCESCGKWVRMIFAGEHPKGTYLIYECENCGRRYLIPKLIVWQYTDFSRYMQQI